MVNVPNRDYYTLRSNVPQNGESCANCRYYFEAACRFLSPVTLDGKTALFPPMAATAWCGRWKKPANGSAKIPVVEPATNHGGRTARFEWAFFREPFRNVAFSEEKALGFNHLYRVANEITGLSKSSFNLVLQKGMEAGELRRVESGPYMGRYWVEPEPLQVPAKTWWQEAQELADQS